MKKASFDKNKRQEIIEQQFELLTSHLGEHFIFAADTQGLIISWNTDCQRVFCYTDEQVIGRPLSMLTDERHHFYDDIASFFPFRPGTEFTVVNVFWMPHQGLAFMAKTDLIPFIANDEQLVGILAQWIRPGYMHQFRNLIASSEHHIGGEIMAIKSAVQEFEYKTDPAIYMNLKKELDQIVDDAHAALMQFYNKLSTLLRKANENP